MRRETEKRHIRVQLENSDWWERQALSHDKSAADCRKRAKNCREEAEFYQAQLDREENGEGV